VSQNQENRQNAANEYWDNNGYYGRGYYGYPVGAAALGAAAVGVTGYALGQASSATVVTELPCTPTEVRVGDQRYYQCDGNWYTKVYSGSTVSFVAVQPPE
jgi:hypothetical protein